MKTNFEIKVTNELCKLPKYFYIFTKLIPKIDNKIGCKINTFNFEYIRNVGTMFKQSTTLLNDNYRLISKVAFKVAENDVNDYFNLTNYCINHDYEITDYNFQFIKLYGKKLIFQASDNNVFWKIKTDIDFNQPTIYIHFLLWKFLLKIYNCKNTININMYENDEYYITEIYYGNLNIKHKFKKYDFKLIKLNTNFENYDIININGLEKFKDKFNCLLWKFFMKTIYADEFMYCLNDNKLFVKYKNNTAVINEIL